MTISRSWNHALKVSSTALRRIVRSWGAGLKYETFNLNDIGGPTQGEYDMKPEVDVIGNLAIMKVANAVIVIDTFIAKYVGDLR